MSYAAAGPFPPYKHTAVKSAKQITSNRASETKPANATPQHQSSASSAMTSTVASSAAEISASAKPSSSTISSGSNSDTAVSKYLAPNKLMVNTLSPPSQFEDQWGAVVTSKFLPLYYRNERFNLQCFPGCNEHGDYATWRREGKTHKKRTGCAFAVSGVIHAPSPGFSHNNVLTLGHITRLDDNPCLYLKVGETYDYAHIQALMEGPTPPSNMDVPLAIKSKLSGGQPTLVRGTNATMGDHAQLHGGQPLEVQFFPSEDRWVQQQALIRTKRTKNKLPTDDKFVFEMLVFVRLCDVSNDRHSGKREYKLVSKPWSNLFEITSTRTLKRALQASISTTTITRNTTKRNKKKQIKRKQDNIDSSKRKNVHCRAVQTLTDVNTNTNKKVRQQTVEIDTETSIDNYAETSVPDLSFNTLSASVGASGGYQYPNLYTHHGVFNVADSDTGMRLNEWHPFWPSMTPVFSDHSRPLVAQLAHRLLQEI